MAESNRQAVLGLLLGTALGDALGLPAEGMKPQAIQRRFGALDRFHLLGRTGFVSDDTEQSALVAQSLILARDADGCIDIDRAVTAFRRAMIGWFLRLPFGIGLATVRACLRMMIGMRRTGISSAGVGAAMRAAIVGAALPDDPAIRREVGRRIAETTHVDRRAVEGALFVAELAALAAQNSPTADRSNLVRNSLAVVDDTSLTTAIQLAVTLAGTSADTMQAASQLGTSGFVLHSVPFSTFGFLRFGDDPLRAVQQVIAAGGDADTNAAICGALAGALCGSDSLPRELLDRIHDGPFGPTHLRRLAEALCSDATRPPAYSWAGAMLRNLCLFPVILGHVLRRLLPV